MLIKVEGNRQGRNVRGCESRPEPDRSKRHHRLPGHGCGAQKGYSEIIRGSEVDLVLLPKVKFEIVVSSEEWEKKVIDAIREAAFTGEMGDGKIFSYEIRSATKIRTGETGYDALQSQA